MAIRTTTQNPYYGSGNGYYSVNSTREVNPLKKPDTVEVPVPAGPPLVGQQWPRGNV